MTPDMNDYYVMEWNEKTRDFDQTGIVHDWETVCESVNRTIVRKRVQYNLYLNDLKKEFEHGKETALEFVDVTARVDVSSPTEKVQMVECQMGESFSKAKQPMVTVEDLKNIMNIPPPPQMKFIDENDLCHITTSKLPPDSCAYSTKVVSEWFRTAFDKWLYQKEIFHPTPTMDNIVNYIKKRYTHSDQLVRDYIEWSPDLYKKSWTELSCRHEILFWFFASGDSKLRNLINLCWTDSVKQFIMEGGEVCLDFPMDRSIIATLQRQFTRGINTWKTTTEGHPSWYVTWLQSAQTWYLNWARWIDLALAAGGLFLGYKVGVSIYAALTTKQAFIFSEGYKTATSKKSKKIDLQRLKEMCAPHTQMGRVADQQANDIAKSILLKNYYTITFPWAETVSGFGVFICDNILMTPCHFATLAFNMAEQNPKLLSELVTLHKHNSGVKISVPLAHYLDPSNVKTMDSELWEGRDWWLSVIPSAPKHKDIRDKFITQKMFDNMNRPDLCLYVPPSSGNPIMQTWSGTGIKGHGLTPKDKTTGLVYKIKNFIQYPCTTQVGDCGALCVLNDLSSGHRKLAGIHIAGNPTESVGFSCAVIADDLFAETKHLELTIENDVEVQMASTLTEKPSYPDGRFTKVADMPKAVYQSKRHRQIPTEMRGDWSLPALEPSVLGTKNGIDPMQLALTKFGKPQLWIDPEKIQLAVDDVFDTMNAAEKIPVSKRIYTFEEAVAGLEGEKDFGSINRQASAGFPYSYDSTYKDSSKSFFFGKEDEYTFDGPAIELKCEVENAIVQASKGHRMLWINIDKLKDEKLPLEKVVACKTRLYTCAALSVVIMMRMYFGAWCLSIRKNKIDNGFAIGTNRYSNDWQRIVHFLSRTSPSLNTIGAGDFSAYDGSCQCMILLALVEIVNRWYDDGDVNARIRKTLWLEVCQSRHLCVDQVVEWFGGNSSGNPLTTEVNCLYGQVAFRLMWMECFKSSDSIVHFRDHVALLNYGDDHLWAVSEEMAPVFNDQFLAENFGKIGMSYTNETKSKEVFTVRDLEDVTFLKCGFRFEKLLGRTVSTLDMVSVCETPYWYAPAHGEREKVLTDAIDSSLCNLALHPPEVWEQYAPLMINSLKKHYNLVPKFSKREQWIIYSSTKEEVFC